MKNAVMLTVLMVLVMGGNLCSAADALEVVLPDGEVRVLGLSTLAAIGYTEVEITLDKEDEVETRVYGGIPLEGIINFLNYEMAEVIAIRFISEDGYVVEAPKEVLTGTGILARTFQGEPIRPSDQPFRLILPDQPQMYWVKACVRMEILAEAPQVHLQQVFFFETIAPSLVEAGKAAVKDLVALFDTPHTGFLSFKSQDGLFKRERLMDIAEAEIMLTGDDAPLFTGAAVHTGRQIKNLVWLHDGYSLLVFLDSLMAAWPTMEVIGGNVGLNLVFFLASISFDYSQGVTLIASDGYSVDIDPESLSKGIIYLDENGIVRTAFSDLPRSHNLKELKTIKVLAEAW